MSVGTDLQSVKPLLQIQPSQKLEPGLESRGTEFDHVFAQIFQVGLVVRFWQRWSRQCRMCPQLLGGLDEHREDASRIGLRRL